jgi:glycosyltransferase involved in cell wall biosynthesis
MRLTIIALHPISYQLPLFLDIQRLGKYRNIFVKTVFLDKLTLRKSYHKEIDGILDIDPGRYLHTLDHVFSFNLASPRITGFLSRINPSLIWHVFRSDVVLIHGYENLSYLYVLVLARLFAKTLLFRGEAVTRRFFARGSSHPSSISSGISQLKSFYVNLYLRSSRYVFYSCSGNESYFRGHRVPSESLVFFPCCVDNDLCRMYVSGESRNILRLRYGISEDTFVIGYAGRITSRKHLSAIVAASAFVSDADKKRLHLLLIGGGPESTSLSDLANRNGLPITVTSFLSHLNGLSHLNCLDVFCMPSLYDPSPKSLNEAMNFSLPLLVSQGCGTAYDLVRPGQNGFVFDPSCPRDLARHISYLMNLSPSRLSEMGELSREIVANYSTGQAAVNLLDSLDRI